MNVSSGVGGQPMKGRKYPVTAVGRVTKNTENIEDNIYADHTENFPIKNKVKIILFWHIIFILTFTFV